MDRTPRNRHLLSQVSEANPFKAELAHRIFAIGAGFEKAVADVGGNTGLSQKGKTDAARVHLQKALRELDDAQNPIADYRKQTAQLRSELKVLSYDKSDISAALLRRELRDRAIGLSFGQRAALMGDGPTRDTDFIDAVSELKPWASGFNMDNPNEAALYIEAQQSRSRDLNASLLDALEARAGVEAEISMVLDIVRHDLESDAVDLTATRAA